MAAELQIYMRMWLWLDCVCVFLRQNLIIEDYSAGKEVSTVSGMQSNVGEGK